MSALKGKTVYYIPLVAFIPGFVVTAATMKVALAKVGMNLQVCNGQGQPSAIASCVQQATGAGAAGIVTDAIPYGMAQNALDAAKAKGIPIIIADQIPPSGTPNTDAVTYVPGVVDQPSQIAWWIDRQFAGQGQRHPGAGVRLALLDRLRAGLAVDLQAGLPRLRRTASITATSNAQLASDTSSNLLAHPNATTTTPSSRTASTRPSRASSRPTSPPSRCRSRAVRWTASAG